MSDETYQNQDGEKIPETPLQRASLESAVGTTAESQANAEHEADVVIGDVSQYVTESSAGASPEDVAELENWQIPTDPLEGVPDDVNFVDADLPPLVSVFAASSEAEGNIVRGLLEAEGIPAIFQDVAAGSFGSVFSVSAAHWADVLVPADQAEQARAAIASAQQASEMPQDSEIDS